MKLQITYWTKGKISCPTCKSDNIVVIFLRPNRIHEIIRGIDKNKVKLTSSSQPSSDFHWVCKNCFDVGELVNE